MTLDADRMDRALAVYGPEYIQKNMDKGPALTSYAAFWSRLNKNLESALEAAKKTAELTPDAAGNWATLGQIYLKLNRHDEAIKATEKAVEKARSEQQKEIYRKQIEQIKKAAEEKK